MDKRKINLNNLEGFLSKAKNKLNEGIEDIGEKNMNLLEEFFSDVKKTKENLENNNNIININESKNYNNEKELDKPKLFTLSEFEVEYKGELFNQMMNIVDNTDVPFDVDFKSESANPTNINKD